MEALPVEADTKPPANVAISSETDTDINEVVTAAENDSAPIAPPEIPTVFASASTECRAPTDTEDDSTDRLSPDDSSTEPTLDS
jgi:hypothetical protein